MNKTQFIDAVAGRLNADHKSTANILDAILDEVYTNVAKGEKVILTGFGAFERRDRAARIGRNPATGAKVRVKKTSVPAFRPGTEFKEIIAGRRKVAKAAPAKKTTAASKAAPAKKTTAATKTTATKATPAKKTTATKAAPARKATATKATATKSTATKATATKATASKSTAAKTLASKATPAKKTTAAKTLAKKTPAKKAPAKRAR